MTLSAVRMVQGLLIGFVGLAMSGSAHAQTYTWTRWRNADTSHGAFYLGVAGGQTCTGGVCGLVGGTQLMTWQKSGPDQVWGVMTEPPPGLINAVAAIINSVPGAVSQPLGPGGQMGVGLPAGQPGKNTQLVIAATAGPHSTWWSAETAESLGAPFPGCYALQGGVEGMYMSVYQGSVKNGSAVVLWPLCEPGSGNCGNPSSAWHPDQFWCPEAPAE